MQLPLSDRLAHCAKFISGGVRVADIGCDHGYLGIHLLLSGRASEVIAADINEGPLDSAMRNAHRFGVNKQITFYLCDGATGIPHNFDILVCAGMGADTIIHILQDAPWLRDPHYRLVLQCQSKTPMLRKYLSDHGWHLQKESIVKEGKFLYTVMAVHYRPALPRLTDTQCYLPPAMTDGENPYLPEYYRRTVEGLRLAVVHQNDPEKRRILEELEQDPKLDRIREVLNDNCS